MTATAFVSLLLVGLAASSTAAPSDAAVVGGTLAYPGQLPWQAGIFSESVSVANLRGSGALISQKFVVTSASAVSGEGQLQVLLGAVSISRATRDPVPVQSKVTHGDWNQGAAENDIAILDLGVNVLLDDNISPIRLPLRSFRGATYVGQTLTISGWGGSNSVDSNQDLLTISNLDVTRNKQCQGLRGLTASLPWTTMCTLASADGGLCKGDSGDPAIFLEADGEYTLIGVVSSDMQCDAQVPSTLARITEHLDWIGNNTDVTIA